MKTEHKKMNLTPLVILNMNKNEDSFLTAITKKRCNMHQDAGER